MRSFEEFMDRSAQEYDKVKGVDASQAGWEKRAVKEILKYFGKNMSQNHLLDLCEERSGARQVTLSWLTDTYNFPLYLGAAKIPKIRDLVIKDLFDLKFQEHRIVDRFAKNPLYLAFDDLCDSFDHHRPVGLIFPWPRIPIPFFILHNARDLDPHEGTYLVKRYQQQTLYLEPLRQVLAAIDQVWSPA